jgi:hypothetical protein
MKKVFFSFIFLIILVGCSTAGVKNIEYKNFERTLEVNAQYDDLWGYLLEWSAVRGFPIASTNKNDGIMVLRGSGTVTRSFLLSGDGAVIDDSLVSCGDPTGNIGLYKAKFTNLVVDATIILRPVGDKTRVTVNLSGNVGVEVRNGYGVVSNSQNTCASRGVFEKELFADLKLL